jgi:uncharacterized protein (DUF934 family)
MRCLLRRREIVRDDWRHWGDDPHAAPQAAGLIIPWQELRANRQVWSSYAGPLGVRIAPADKVEDLVEDLKRFALVAVEFPTPIEGRGYTQGRLLRERFGFSAELRAVGAAVKRDLIFALARCGFDAFEVAAGEELAACAQALDRYSVAYQSAPGAGTLRQRSAAETR